MQPRIEVRIQVEIQLKIQVSIHVATQAKTQLMTLVPERRRILRSELLSILREGQGALRRAFNRSLRRAIIDERRVMDPLPPVGLTSSAAELEFFVDWIVSVKAEMRRGQARLRHV